MIELTASAEELIACFRDLFPREYDISFLTLANRKQGQRIAELEAAEAQQARSDHA